MRIDTLTPDQRVEALLFYFGWQGGTIHQLAEATGCSVADLLYRDHEDTKCADPAGGFCAIRTCGLAWRRDVLAPRAKGDWPYWRDVIIGYWATGALSAV